MGWFFFFFENCVQRKLFYPFSVDCTGYNLDEEGKEKYLLLHTSSKYCSHHPTLVIILTEKSAPDSPHPPIHLITIMQSPIYNKFNLINEVINIPVPAYRAISCFIFLTTRCYFVPFQPAW